MPTKLEVVTTYIESEVKQKLEKWAKGEDRSISYIVARLIEKAIEEREHSSIDNDKETTSTSKGSGK
ncbi:CopG family transcriptional regulator [Lusitaniella coriacea LEGE 07157]|uniref:CopG family transcriptional regulator n=2 Tax=Lusitaniella TaxID=1983104 RepID=A0A8J7DZJ6_9CYAN|nr:CopG family transcriptional regulator [Lusitaniella coriacea LEGE 07157]